MLYVNEKQYVNGVKQKERTIISQQQQQQQHDMKKPYIPIELWEALHDISLFLIVDDQHDLGRFSYYGDESHYYRFQKRPDHPSPFHHYQLGILGLVVSQIGALFSTVLDIKNGMMEEKELPNRFHKIIDLPLTSQTEPAMALPPPKSDILYSKLTQALDSE